MSKSSLLDRIPIRLQVLAGLCIFCVILLAVIFFWYLPGTAPTPHTNATVHIKIIGVNDFHGYMPPGQMLNNRPVGSAPVLASYLKSAMTSGNADGIILAFPGDVIGNSPPQSGLLLDEPAMLFFNGFANQNCLIGSNPQNASCNVVATLGNNEFDNGIPELFRMINGGNGMTTIPHIVDPYPGSRLLPIMYSVSCPGIRFSAIPARRKIPKLCVPNMMQPLAIENLYYPVPCRVVLCVVTPKMPGMPSIRAPRTSWCPSLTGFYGLWRYTRVWPVPT